MKKKYLGIILLLLASALGTETRAANENMVGKWNTLSYTMPINPIHVALLRNGKILVVAGSEYDPTSLRNRAAIVNLSAGTIAARDIEWDLFCNAMNFLPDGRALITGGTDRYDPFYGAPYAIFYDPSNDTFVEGPRMSEGRWYPTDTVIKDRRTVVISGLTRTGRTSRTLEIFDLGGGGRWTSHPIPFTPDLYPRAHLLPNGQVFYSGPGTTSRIFNPATIQWNLNVARTNYGAVRKFGSSVLLPLSPSDGYAPKVLIMGGHSPATNSAELIDLSGPAPKWVSVGSMAQARIQLNATILPNGRILATGGSTRNEVASTASKKAEWFNPGTNTWSTLATAQYPRLYHSVALLLPDGRVWTAGSNPARGTVERHMEIFSPPYLYTTNASGQVVLAPRPSISSAPTSIGYDVAFDIGAPKAANIDSVVLIRPGAVTHAFDMEQRMVKLDFSVLPGNKLRAISPRDAAIAPHGYYVLFLTNRGGTPSVARFIQLQ